MQHLHYTKLPIWSAARLPPSEQQHPYKGGLFDFEHPLRPFVVQFHRWATLLLVALADISIAVWLALRVIYPQPEPHFDDLSGYNILFSGETTHPEVYQFQIIPREYRPETSQKMLIGVEQTDTYIDTTNPSPIAFYVIDQQKQTFRFTLYSNQLRLYDLLWRWGRPDYKERGLASPGWHLEWREPQYGVDTFVSRLNLNTTVKWITITSN